MSLPVSVLWSSFHDSGFWCQLKKKKKHTKEVRVQFYLGTIARETDSQLWETTAERERGEASVYVVLATKHTSQ